MSDPYVYTDGHTGTTRLVIVPGCNAAEVSVKGGTFVSVTDPAPVVAALYEAAGKPAPTLIEGYGDAGISQCMIGGIHVYLTGGRRVRIEGNQDVPPALARQIARMLVSIADAAESEPDPAEVAELTGVLRDVTPGMALPGSDYKTAVARNYAEAALRWMREREGTQ